MYRGLLPPKNLKFESITFLKSNIFPNSKLWKRLIQQKAFLSFIFNQCSKIGRHLLWIAATLKLFDDVIGKESKMSTPNSLHIAVVIHGIMHSSKARRELRTWSLSKFDSLVPHRPSQLLALARFQMLSIFRSGYKQMNIHLEEKSRSSI
jgi:hypothetical protein